MEEASEGVKFFLRDCVAMMKNVYTTKPEVNGNQYEGTSTKIHET